MFNKKKLLIKIEEYREINKYVSTPKKVKKNRYNSFTVPVNLPDFNSLPPGITKRNIYFCIEHVWQRTCSEKWENLLKKDGFTPMPYSVLYQVMGSAVTKTLKYLVDAKIFECDNHFDQAKGIATGYKIAERYRFSDPQRIELNSRRVDYTIDEEITLKFPYITEWFADLEFDYESALIHIYKKRADDLKVVRKNQFRKREKIQASFIHAFHSIHRLKEKNYNVSVSGTNGRLNSTISLMRKDLKQYLTWKGHKLVSVDIKCSQPFISLLLVNRYKEEFLVESTRPYKFFNVCNIKFYNEYQLNKLIFQYNITNSKQSMSISSVSIPIYLNSDNPVTHCQGVTDILFYQILIEKGLLYDYLRLKYSEVTGIIFESRSEAKLEIFHMMYSTNYWQNQIMKRIFKASFPTVHKIFEYVKSEKHNALAIILQSIESEIMLGHVAKRAGALFPIITIHDCLMVLEENIAEAQTIIEEEMERKIGIRPETAVEYF